ncbi:MAG TPA: heavy metal-associated domain-containing protein [Phycisphaerales bacterium]|nr:heavy metal-associated domain-containing protein [Phycisphaerales bacterium]
MRIHTLILSAVFAAILTACGSTKPAGMSKENAIIHQVTEADVAQAHSKEPLKGQTVTLWVNGLGCPQCASNIDQQMKRTEGVTSVRTDLGHGKVYLTLSGKTNPSPYTLSERTLDAGFTLVKVEQP